MTFDLWKLIQIKENTLKSTRRNPNSQRLKDLLVHISKKVQRDKAACKRNYYTNLLSRGDQKSAWKLINGVLGKQQQRGFPKEIHMNGRISSDTNEICQNFNEYFCNVGPALAASINSDRNIYKFNTLTRHQQSIFLHPATINEVTILINELSTKKSPGPDNIPARFVKLHHNVFAPLLTDIFNEIVQTGIYPNCLKVARVTPVYKSGDMKDPTNYRPISCLSILDKIIEKLIVNRITNFTDHHRLIYSHQYGFRRGLSTLTASCDLVEEIYDSLDNRKIVGSLFIDLKKAFDTINHEMLIDKLEAYGIRGVAKSLIKSYLSNRYQFVSNGVYKSPLGAVTTGVPQGSNLGPILFLIFINDLAQLNLHGKLRLFADDTSVFYQGTGCTTIQFHMKQDLLLLQDYFETNLMSMNLSKTKYMIINSHRRQLPDREPIIIADCVIEEVYEFSFLGLTLDCRISWKAHIESLKRKLASLCGILRKVSSYLPLRTMKMLYFSLIHSRLQYLVATWGLACKSSLRELQVIQNRSLKAVFRKPHLYPSHLLYEEPRDSILPIRALQEYQMLILLRNNTTSSTLATRRMHENRSSRQTGHLYLSRINKEFGRKKISYIGSKLFNDLPLSCKNAPTIQIFKRRLRAIIKTRIPQYLA